ncbi:hypothetical protein GCM10011579_000580 [Streptomyces albiflavescens]|uniref:Uncharacterized protein n=1 Tax=Streptomyces albiflavescens TaxID=1623582 RepID=A0A917XPU2_9ACTN|nr:hypothetical protein [Streptomyces albiflavescens]GGN48178.1 hypothetical protein GCM10011579_000580 [Streptomyces albiflavescens]
MAGSDPKADLHLYLRDARDALFVRELIDGVAGLRKGGDNMASGDSAWWESHRDRLERIAEEAGRGM